MKTRTNLFTTTFGRKKKIKEQFFTLYEEKKGDWAVIEPILLETKGVAPKLIRALKFTHELADWSGDSVPLVEMFQQEKTTHSLRDIALQYNREQLMEKLGTVELAETAIDLPTFARELALKLYQKEPTAVIQRMLGDTRETPITNKVLSGNLATFFSNQPLEFNIQRDSIYQAFQREEAFKDIDDEIRETVKTALKALQRVAAIAPVPEALPVLMQQKITSAFQVSSMPQEQFVATFAKKLDADEAQGTAMARQIHTNAANARIRNEQALIAMREVGQGTGIDFIDAAMYGREIASPGNPLAYIPGREDGPTEHLSWDLLFSDADLCECGHCTSVYSPAAYFVELLQYLRNNNLDPDKIRPANSYTGTPLEFLFDRRTDLGCLQLTCENTNTLLPYVDLVNEIMENYIVFQTTKAFNVTDETSAELLAQPQHTEYEAYCILHKAVYPFTLPYHQPIDAIRIFLNFLKTSRYELLDTFRSQRKTPIDTDSLLPCDQADNTPEDAAQKALLDDFHQAYLDRAVAAECLEMTQEEYVILTKEAFVSKAYWDAKCNEEHTQAEYQDKIGLKPVHEYYGYETEADMLSLDESQALGLTFVKKQFLPRTGIAYTDLVDLLTTQFLNPNMPQGEARAIMESIQFSYRYLQSLVNENAQSADAKYKDLIEFLNSPGDFLPEFRRRVDPREDPCNPREEGQCLKIEDIKRWVYCYFEQVGKIIMLENGVKSCNCPEGQFFWRENNGNVSDHRHLLGENGELWMDDGKYFLDSDCQVWAEGRVPELESDVREIIGHVNKYTGELVLTKGTFEATEADGRIFIETTDGEIYNLLQDVFLHYRTREPIGCRQGPVADNCDLDTVRLVHLDGSPLTVEEYDCFHRFIRLWRKLEWTIDETDKAIIGLGKVAKDCGDDLFDGTEDCDDLFEEGSDCSSEEGDGSDCFNKKHLTPKCEITPELLHQLVAIKKLLDKTGLELIKLLTFWTNISTVGEKSLYQRLFLRHNVQALDPVFKADKNGLYLIGKDLNTKNHFPVLMAALKVKADDLHAILKLTNDSVLNLENVSLLYRYRLLSRVIGEKIPVFIDALALFGDVFKDAHSTLSFLEHWLKMEDAGFSFRQLKYIIQDVDFDLRPYAPTQKEILLLAKTLYDGLNIIETTHPDITPDTIITEELIRVKMALLFDPLMVEKILGLLLGTTLYSTNAPLDLSIVIPEVEKSLKAKLRYSKTGGTIQLTGILTDIELMAAKALDNDLGWKEALDRIAKQPKKLFKEVLADIFDHQKAMINPPALIDEAKDTLLSGDIKLPIDQIPDGQPDPNTLALKQEAFLKVFLPYLRQQLRERFVIDTLSGLTGVERKVVEVLIFEILQGGNPAVPIYSIFEAIKNSSALPASGWDGFLIPAAKATYTFVVNSSNAAPSLKIDGQVLTFIQEVDPTNEWWSIPIELQAGKVCTFEVTGISNDLKDLRWKTPISTLTEIPTNSLLPDYATAETGEAYTVLQKMAMVVNGFQLKAEELRHFHLHPSDFDGLDFNALSLTQWFRLEAYTRLRSSLSVNESMLPKFFQWANQPDDPSLLIQKITELTLWEKEKLAQLITEPHFNLNAPAHFTNEINLLKLHHALEVADKIGMDIDLLFEWAKPTSHFDKTHKIAQDIQKTVRAQYLQEDWEQVVRPLNDELRNNQRDALMAYLLVQPTLVDWGVTDADGLFEYFLIDVQMDACMETSRIKQGISSVQLFIQRCFLGLEAKDILNDKLDRDRWGWMQRYRVWEANRKVFLYPENWIESNLRDDKSPFYKELESELLQNDVNPQNVTDALKSYLYKVDEVANLEIVGLHIEERKKLHVFARTRNAPYFFYYRYLNIEEANWYPWKKMQVDIPTYNVTNNNGEVTGNGCYVTPYVWNGRLLVFFPHFMKKTIPLSTAKTTSEVANVPPSAIKPIEYWEIKLGWSEYRNGEWTQKQLGKEVVNDLNFAKAKTASDAVLAAAETTAKEKELDDKVHEALDVLEKKRLASEAAAAAYQSDDSDENRDIFQNAINDFNHYNNNIVIPLNNKFGAAVQAKIEAVKKAKELKTELIRIISKYEFVPVLSDNLDYQLLGIILYYNNEQEAKGAFDFNGTNIQSSTQTYSKNNTVNINFFHHHDDLKIKSLQADVPTAKYVFDNDEVGLTMYEVEQNATQNFHHPHVQKLMGKLNTAELEDFFSYNLEIPDKWDAFGNSNYHELKRPYALYNWELFFHAPMMLANELSETQQFEKAMQWYHYVFNPMAEGKDAKRFWQFCPFKETNGEDILVSIFNSLQPNTPNDGISEWRNKPFRPHLIARSRPVAYMKWTVMKYLDNLIEWGDYLFRQDTIESLNYATQLYVMASHILGKRPHFIPKRGKVQPQTYLSLLDKWDAFSNAVVELEIIAPYSNQINEPLGTVNGEPALANIFGFGTTLYFCIPNNPKLLAYWDTIADRLFKIRHCMNIEGVVRKLPLFEPPIDPALLVRATAQGLSIASVLNDLNTPLPNYRFYYLLQKALELCNEVKSLGNAMLSALEKRDNEKLALLRAQHEHTIQNMLMDVRDQQLEEAQQSLKNLQYSRKAPENQMQFFLKVSGEDINKMPGFDEDFAEILNKIEAPVDESGFKINKYEEEEIDKSHQARGWKIASHGAELLSAIAHALPDLDIATMPLGNGSKLRFGGRNLGDAANAVSKGLDILSSQYSFESSNAEKKSKFLRAYQDRIRQVNALGYELKQIDKQILNQEIRIAIAHQEIKNQQQQIDNAKEIENFLENKYSNEELYTWMKGELKTLYYQVYSLAYELAKKAEKVFRFERGLSSSNFIQSGYWNTGREGLLAGESLYIGLKKLEAAWHEKKGHDYEITKNVSLRQINPLALLQLRATGKCELEMSEMLFDMDFPNHYQRRIKSVSISVPCVVGPYTSLNATLRLLEHKYRISSIAKNKNDYPENQEEMDERFLTHHIPISSVAVSTAQNDIGLFELNFRDDRYLPFEGAGAVSKWRIELPSEIRQFDYNTINDVIIHLRYTSKEGGERMKMAAAETVREYLKSVEELGQQEGIFALIDLKHDLPTQWHKSVVVAPEEGLPRIMDLSKIGEFMPYFAKFKNGQPRDEKDLLVSDLQFILEGDLIEGDIHLEQNGIEHEFEKGVEIGEGRSFVIRDAALQLDNWNLFIKKENASLSNGFVLLKLQLK